MGAVPDTVVCGGNRKEHAARNACKSERGDLVMGGIR